MKNPSKQYANLKFLEWNNIQKYSIRAFSMVACKYLEEASGTYVSKCVEEGPVPMGQTQTKFYFYLSRLIK